MYDPTVGEFINEDPIGFDAEDANLMRYVGNGPTMATDPSGLRECYDNPDDPMFKNYQDRSEKLERIVNSVIATAWKRQQKFLEPFQSALSSAMRNHDPRRSPFSREEIAYAAATFMEATARVAASVSLVEEVYDKLGADQPGSKVDTPLGKKAPIAKIGVLLDKEVPQMWIGNTPYGKNTISGSRFATVPWLWSLKTFQHGLAPTIKIKDTLMGTDKWEHFFQQGYWYWQLTAYPVRRSNIPQGFGDLTPKGLTGLMENRWSRQVFGYWLEGLPFPGTTTEAHKWHNLCAIMAEECNPGERMFPGYFGMAVTGVASRADEHANEQGYQFYCALQKAFVNNPDKRFVFSVDQVVNLHLMNEHKNTSVFSHHLKYHP